MTLLVDPPAAPPPTPPSSTPSPDAGVIEEARRRQRRRRLLCGAIGAVLAVGAGVALLAGGGGGSGAGDGRLAFRLAAKLTLVHGQPYSGGAPAYVGISPSLKAGNVGVEETVVDRGGGYGSPPTAGDPAYAGYGWSPEKKVGPDGEIDAAFTGPAVAAVRVAHLGTFETHRVPGYPADVREAVFYRPPGSPGTVLPIGTSRAVLRGSEEARHAPVLTETPLDAAGRPIPAREPPTFMLPSAYWRAPQTQPAAGRCSVTSTLPGVRGEWGESVTEIASDRAITTAAWLSCMDAWLSHGGVSYEVALLLDAAAPGRAPAPLWGAVPVSGHPGVFQIKAVERRWRFPIRGHERTFTSVYVPRAVIRRVGPAWLVVRYGGSLAQRIDFLDSLRASIRLPGTARLVG
ncbi:MAG TPA: hypothetical protein VMU32_03470 [Solirubrobacteraceae bacterium]|nr:hypothetical protein [Solirubrobacteraceae bacterium]